ncbi:hypothetical protein CGRA01v4_02087 [Colletotrichum graminicola]|nr:hypothetical protein CGRA01v4_02087 [Colletotrichum graminicola]
MSSTYTNWQASSLTIVPGRANKIPAPTCRDYHHGNFFPVVDLQTTYLPVYWWCTSLGMWCMGVST